MSFRSSRRLPNRLGIAETPQLLLLLLFFGCLVCEMKLSKIGAICQRALTNSSVMRPFVLPNGALLAKSRPSKEVINKNSLAMAASMYYRALTVALGRIFHLLIALRPSVRVRPSNFRVKIEAPREQKGS